MKVSRRELMQIAALATAFPLHAAEAPGLKQRRKPVVAEKIPEKLRPLPFESLSLGGLFAERMRVNVEGRLRHIDREAFLSGFINRDKGDAHSYVGEHAGKFLDAASNALSYKEDADLRRIADHVARTLIQTQVQDGYLGTYPAGQRWDQWDVWVHKYNLIGLLSYYELTGDEAALTACRKMGDLLDRTYGEAPGKREIASGLHIGMASTSVLEPMCRLYRFTGEKRYLEFCQYIVRSYQHPGGPGIVGSLLAHGSVYRTANGKAYEMLSNLVGLVDLYRLSAEESLLQAVLRAWDDIVQHQLYFTGTTSAGEHFQPPGQLLALQSSNVGEMCVTVTWLQLNWRLFRLTGEPRFGQEIERSVYNHLFAGQHPLSGKISYYTSLVGCKEHTDAVLCCVSSGPRGISLIPQLAWGLEQRAFVVNLFTSGTAQFEMEGAPVQVISKTEFPAEGNVTLAVNPGRAVRFAMKIRVPEWVTRFEAKSGPQTWRGTPGRMLEIDRDWQPASTIQISMDLPVRTRSGGAEYSEYIAFQRGPQVLALDKAANPSVRYLARAGVPAPADSPKLNSLGAQRYTVDGVSLQGQNPARIEPSTLTLVPFADALDYRVWISRSDRVRRDIPPVTAFARASSSDVNLHLEPTDQQDKFPDLAESLTDENAKTFCIVNPTRPTVMAQLHGQTQPTGKREDPVWFLVMLDEAQDISRVVFRHGKLGPNGGWFDASKGKPRLEVLTHLPAQWGKGSFAAFVAIRGARWEKAADFDDYPKTDAVRPPDIEDGQPFEIRLAQPLRVYALRIVGVAGGDHANCAEISAYRV